MKNLALQVYGWEPKYYRASDLPNNMSDDLKEKIESIDENDERVSQLLLSNLDNLISFLQHEMIWVSCEGENPADIENLGPINYYPERGFPGYFFPFMNQKGYMPPVMAINFERPKSKFNDPKLAKKIKIWIINDNFFLSFHNFSWRSHQY